MTIFIDDMQRPARVNRLNSVWSHLMSNLPGPDGTAELLAFATSIGQQRRWIQNAGKPTEHFDLTEPQRQKALRAGATPIQYGAEGGNMTRAKRMGLVFDLDAFRAGTWVFPPKDEPAADQK